MRLKIKASGLQFKVGADAQGFAAAFVSVPAGTDASVVTVCRMSCWPWACCPVCLETSAWRWQVGGDSCVEGFKWWLSWMAQHAGKAQSVHALNIPAAPQPSQSLFLPAGTIVEMHPTVYEAAPQFHMGQLVVALCPGGGIGSYVTVHVSLSTPVPPGLCRI